MEVDAPQDVDIVVWQVVPQTAQLIVQLLIMDHLRLYDIGGFNE